MCSPLRYRQKTQTNHNGKVSGDSPNPDEIRAIWIDFKKLDIE